LTQPEERLLANRQVRIRVGHMNQLGDALFFRQLAQCKHGFFLNGGFRIVLNGIGEGLRCPFSGLLRNPEQRLPADLGLRI
jgi:hypothetical protein